MTTYTHPGVFRGHGCQGQPLPAARLLGVYQSARRKGRLVPHLAPLSPKSLSGFVEPLTVVSNRGSPAEESEIPHLVDLRANRYASPGAIFHSPCPYAVLRSTGARPRAGKIPPFTAFGTTLTNIRNRADTRQGKGMGGGEAPAPLIYGWNFTTGAKVNAFSASISAGESGLLHSCSCSIAGRPFTQSWTDLTP